MGAGDASGFVCVVVVVVVAEDLANVVSSVTGYVSEEVIPIGIELRFLCTIILTCLDVEVEVKVKVEVVEEQNQNQNNDKAKTGFVYTKDY
jgi:hypothetical protein